MANKYYIQGFNLGARERDEHNLKTPDNLIRGIAANIRGKWLVKDEKNALKVAELEQKMPNKEITDLEKQEGANAIRIENESGFILSILTLIVLLDGVGIGFSIEPIFKIHDPWIIWPIAIGLPTIIFAGFLKVFDILEPYSKKIIIGIAICIIIISIIAFAVLRMIVTTGGEGTNSGTLQSIIFKLHESGVFFVMLAIALAGPVLLAAWGETIWDQYREATEKADLPKSRNKLSTLIKKRSILSKRFRERIKEHCNNFIQGYLNGIQQRKVIKLNEETKKSIKDDANRIITEEIEQIN